MTNKGGDHLSGMLSERQVGQDRKLPVLLSYLLDMDVAKVQREMGRCVGGWFLDDWRLLFTAMLNLVGERMNGGIRRCTRGSMFRGEDG